ncbi:hypothetical protein CspeluHIS016_0114020 [Cutaneotrichosporon spelunceum]|uniref:Uncharacterized protein n=1 Tax=Cutaneotrichosporon spelunceum TaxID=1672016 RepID=A0AAD3Y9E8_9TREE|nr:hypothetical protein CspeluHIS016_0114020 [Cutaneotrichosporon spelunceum]
MSYDCATYPVFDAASTAAPPAYHIPSVYNLRACVAAPNALTTACCAGANVGYGGTTDQCGWTVCVTDASNEQFAACLAANGAPGASFNCADKIDYPDPEPPVTTTTSATPEPSASPPPALSSSEAAPTSSVTSPEPVTSESPSSATPSSEVPTSSGVVSRSSTVVASSTVPPSSSSAILVPTTGSGAPPPAPAVPTTVIWRTVTSSSASKSSASATPNPKSGAAQRTVAGACVVLGALGVPVSLQ